MEERILTPSSKVLDAYPTPPQLRRMERTTPEQRRRSRDLSVNAGSPNDLLPTDPIFVLRRVQHKALATGPMQPQQASAISSPSDIDGRGPLSPQEIIAAQRAASRASQKALISAHENSKQGVDVIVPDRGTFRSSRLLEPQGEVVRYSYIDGSGETYDISEILEEEFDEKARSSPNIPAAPSLLRTHTDSSTYITAPSTPEPEAEKKLERPRSQDLLQGILHRVGDSDDRLEEKLHRVINKVKSGNVRAMAAEDPAATPTGRTTPQGRLASVPEGRAADLTPRASSRQNFTQTAVTVNRIVSRHRQQPSIASIMSDLSASPAPESIRDRQASQEYDTHDEDLHTGTGASTPLTATSSTHPTPPFHSINLFTRSVSSASPTPRRPVVYTDDFGIKTLMAIIDVRSRVAKPKNITVECDEVEKRYYGEKIEWDGVQQDVKGIFGGLMGRLEKFDRDIDEILAGIIKEKEK